MCGTSRPPRRDADTLTLAMQRAPLVLSASLVLGAGLACNSDDLYAVEGSSSTGAAATSSGEPTTGEPGTSSTSSSSDASSSTGPADTGDAATSEPPPPQQTCEEVLMCVGECALTLDPACFQMCAEGLEAEEASKAFDLLLCVGSGCFESEACTPETLQEPLCLACLGFGILNKNPPGCEEEADACM